jgi:hypothetical protein
MTDSTAEGSLSPKPTTADHAAIYGLVYLESQRNLTQQAAVLDNIRTRAGLVITAASVVTAFLGAPAIKNATTPASGSTSILGLTIGGWLAVACFAIVGICSIAILWPRKGWMFRFGAKDILDRVDEHPDETLPGMQRKLALLNEKSFIDNERKISTLFWLLEIAAIALFFEAGFWLSSLAQARILGLQL